MSENQQFKDRKGVISIIKREEDKISLLTKRIEAAHKEIKKLKEIFGIEDNEGGD